MVFAVTQTNGPVQSWSVRTNQTGHRSLFLNLSPQGIAEVTPFAPDVVRVRFYFLGTNFFAREEPAISKPLTNWPSFSNSFIAASATNFLIETAQLKVEVVFSNRFAVHFRDAQGRDLLRDRRIEYDSEYFMINDTSAYAQVAWTSSTSVSNRPTGFKLKAIKEMPANEAYFGLGDEGGPLNRRGRVFQFWTQDTYGFEEFRNPKYTALPFWYGTQGPSTSRPAFAYGVFFNNPARPVVDLSGTNGTYSFEAGDDQLDYFFFGGGPSNSMPAILDRFSELTGRPAFLPKWAYGYHQSRHSYFSQAEVTNLMHQFRSRDIPCDAIYLDIGSQFNGGQNHQLTFNPSYSNVAALVVQATNAGFELVPLVEPLLTTNDPLYAEANTNLYFIKRNNLATHVGTNFLGAVSWLDFSIQQTRNWWRGKLTNYLAQFGFAAIWNDLNEPNENDLPLNALWYLDGRYGDLTTNDTRRWTTVNRNMYSLLQAQVTHDALRARRPENRPFVLSRAAWPGIQSYAAGWSGDNVSTFGHLRFNTRMGLSVMISGQANYGHDVGGFINNTTNDLLVRWHQQGVLHPLYRNHNDLWAVGQEPWAFGEPYTSFNREWIRFRYRLMPYLYTLAHHASTNGTPMNVPTVFHFPHDTNTWHANEYDLLAGTHLLAAPVVEAGMNTRAVYLPSGVDWYHWDTDLRYSGGQTATVYASLSRSPLFAHAGAVIPMGPPMTHVYEFAPSWLEFHVWPGPSNRFVLFEDDGRTTNYLAGAFAKTPVSVQGSATSLTVWIEAREGSFNPGARDFYVVARAMSNVVSATLNGAPLPRRANRDALSNTAGAAWAYDTVARHAWVKVGDDGSARTIQFVAGGATPAPTVFSSAYTNMAVAGTFNLWNEAANNMRLVASSQWAFVTALPAATSMFFKFVANNTWSVNWGDTNQSDFAAPLTQVADVGVFGDDIALSNVVAGVYTFRFHDATRAYSVDFAGSVDSDGDGMNDAWETEYGLNPLQSGDASLDLDGDGISNRDEFIAGTAPTDIESFLAVQSLARSATNGVEISWQAVTGRTYRLQFSTNLLADPAFFILPPFSNLTGAGLITVTDTNAAGSRAYRVGVGLSP